MKTWQAILLTFFIIGGSVFISRWIIVAITMGSAIWGVIDAKKIEIQKYRGSFFARRPVHIFWGMWLLWFIYFPWYLSLRYKIKQGKITLRQES